MTDPRLVRNRLNLVLLSEVLERDRQRTEAIARASHAAIEQSLELLAKINSAPRRVVAPPARRMTDAPV
jgi:hypothetical protein